MRNSEVPIVTVVVASYNKGLFVREAIGSALGQGPIAEVIVIDDASNDGSLETLRDLAHSNRQLRLIECSENRGGSHCRNIGIREARGEYVIFLDADDVLQPDCCRLRVTRAREEPAHDLWVFPMRTFDGNATKSQWVPRPGDHLAHFLAHQLDWSIMQPLWRITFLRRLGGFDESFVRLQDPELHVRALLAGARVRCYPDVPPDCGYRIEPARHGEGIAAMAARHVQGAEHFYRKFIRIVPLDRRPALTGTLFAAVKNVAHWRRAGQLDASAAGMLIRRLTETCELPGHRRVLRAYDLVDRSLPCHVPGLAWSVRKVMGL